MPSLIDKSGNIAYLGQISLANFVDWLVTFCLGAIVRLLDSVARAVARDRAGAAEAFELCASSFSAVCGVDLDECDLGEPDCVAWLV